MPTDGITAELVIEAVANAFRDVRYPGDPYLQGSLLGAEPFQVAEAFRGKTDWTALDAAFLDEHHAAPAFFSPAALRYFLPAYLIADIRGLTRTADPVFYLTNGFSDDSYEQEVDGRKFVMTWGRSSLINPLLYGAASMFDYARYRLAVFTREEAAAIVLYLRWRARADEADGLDRRSIDQALSSFWLERSTSAPSRADLAKHLHDTRAYVDALTRK